MQIRGVGVVRWMASDGHSPYIGENGNWWQWNDAVNDYVDTGVSAKGVPGMPGQIPVQKEWKAGDTHRNDTNIVDYIYVRAPIPDNRKWYKLKNDYVVREVPSDETYPTESTLSTYYDEIPWLKELAAKVLIGEEANLANFIFKEDKLISIRGTVNGVDVDYDGQVDFIPNIVLDGKTGQVSISGSFSSNNNGNRIIIDPVSRSIKGINSSDELVMQLAFDEFSKAFLALYSRTNGVIDREIEISTNVIRIISDLASAYMQSWIIEVNKENSVISFWASVLNDFLDLNAIGLPITDPDTGTVSHNLKIKPSGQIYETLGTFKNVRSIGATSNLLNTDEVVIAIGTSSITLTMPTAAKGKVLKIKNRCTVSITLSSSTQFYTTSLTSVINLAAGAAIELIYDGTYWMALSKY